MKMTPEQFDESRKRASPNSNLPGDCLWAFGVGGGICLGGEVLRQIYLGCGFAPQTAGTLVSCTLVLLSAAATALGWYHKLAARAGAGTLVPITGFANSVVSPAIEFKVEGLITGVGARMFIIAGPGIVYGVTASVVYGLIYWITARI